MRLRIPSKTRFPTQERRYKNLMRISLATGVLLVNACTSTHQTYQTLLEPPPGPVRGYQIQIHTTIDKDSAGIVAHQASAWWSSLNLDLRRTLHGASEIPVEIKWLQPYYRIRIGHFRSKEEARGMLQTVAEQFPAAFVVPDTIL